MNAAVEPHLAALCAFPSVSSRPVEDIAAYLAEHAEAAGMRVERFETSPGKLNVVASAGPAGTDGVILSGHMDVVPVEGQPWTSDPFRLTRRGDRLHARGACDMKAFLAAVTAALPELPLARLDRELTLVWTHDEEVGCLGSKALAERLAALGRPVPRLCLIGEPTSFRILRMHPGHTAVRILCAGRAAHSSQPELGHNAIHDAARVVAAMERLAEEWRGRRAHEDLLDRPFVVMNVARIQGGSAINIVPDACVVELGFRQLPGQDVDALCAEIDQRAREAGAVSTELLRVTPAMYTPAGTALEAVLRPYASDPRLGAASFATDGGNLEALGVRSLVFGPGSIEVAHRADEFVPVGELHRAVDVVAEVVARRCLGAG